MSFLIRNFKEYQDQYKKSLEDPEGFWAGIAENFLWKKPWTEVLKWNFSDPDVKWFLNGKLNITENCLDRHLPKFKDKTAILWEPNNPEDPSKEITFQELFENVCQLANALKRMGVKKGDRVAIYLPMIPELAYTVLACARIGAVHSVVFAGFSASSLSDRINDANAKIVITADGFIRGTKNVALKEVVDKALEVCPSVATVVVAKHTGEEIGFSEDRDCWMEDILKPEEKFCEAEKMDAEDPLFILYTSGSTGKPKGVVHTCGGYMVYTGYTFANVFHPKNESVFWCTADIGWITGHSYVVYGPLLNATTTLMFEGVPNWPDAGRCWQICEKFDVDIFYTAPTAIRSLMMAGDQFVKPYQLNSLRIIGSVGEPINEEAWEWYDEHVGHGKCPIVDTWWQTETGGIMISGMGDYMPQKPSHAGLPLPGIQPVLLDANGVEILENLVEGNLCIKFPWPGILRTIYGDHERCRMNYFAPYKGVYFTGDGAKRDADGLYRIIGRVDDVINVSGHRIGTAEIENAIDESELVVESAVVGFPHPVKGQGIYAYVISSGVENENQKIVEDVLKWIDEEIGKFARPEKIQVVEGLPKTRSGKIMRRILRKIAGGETENLGDTTTLLDPDVVEKIIAGAIK